MLRFSVLGPLVVESGGRPRELGPLKQRLVLAVLLTRPNTPVPVEMLSEALWEGEPPRTARKNLHVYVSALRKLMGGAAGSDRILHGPGGYVLRVGAGESDALRFEELARAGREALRTGSLGQAAGLFREALDLWRGPALADLTCSDLLRREADRWGERWLDVYEAWAETALQLGEAEAVADSVGEAVERHPLRERLRAAQIAALERCGRRTEALAAYDDLRQLLSRELGLEPSPALKAVYGELLGGGPHAAGPSGAFPAGRVLLPRDLPDLTGRKEQVRELLGVLGGGEDCGEGGGDGGLVVLAGPTGAGKTALAVHVAHRLEREFPDGRVLVRMRAEDGSPRPRSSVLAELARLFGFVARLPHDPEEAGAAWRSWAAGRRVLLLLDDAPDEAAVQCLLPGAGRNSVLVTARSRLAGLEAAHRVEVPPFTVPEALELLGRIIGRRRLLSDPDAAGRVVEEAGLLPLGIRVAGTKLSMLAHLPLGEFAERLGRNDTLLDELASGGLAVRSRLAGAWRDLAGPSRSVLQALGALPAPRFTLDEAMAALGLGREDTQRALESLMESCTVSAAPDASAAHPVRFELPRVVHLFARERASEAVPGGSRGVVAVLPRAAG
ncbi:BTAD domain-containing putative transcriptional regulator [Streptomyces sp. NPDC059506]|uniref:AfsR/SARP family transcriptional regulator n=1 Tax=Streptomyces sp. NPDC059506 TaxID=3347751 RepID=UPI0036BCCE95